MQEKTHILDRVSSFSLLLTMIILMIILLWILYSI